MTVIDASVLVPALADDGERGEAARALIASMEELAAPDLIDVEALSVLRRQRLAGGITTRRMRHALADLSAMPIERFRALPFIDEAARHLNNLTEYDALYVVLAAALHTELVTADAKLANAPRLPCNVRLVSDLAS